MDNRTLCDLIFIGTGTGLMLVSGMLRAYDSTYGTIHEAETAERQRVRGDIIQSIASNIAKPGRYLVYKLSGKE